MPWSICLRPPCSTCGSWLWLGIGVAICDSSDHDGVTPSRHGSFSNGRWMLGLLIVPIPALPMETTIVGLSLVPALTCRSSTKHLAGSDDPPAARDSGLGRGRVKPRATRLSAHRPPARTGLCVESTQGLCGVHTGTVCGHHTGLGSRPQVQVDIGGRGRQTPLPTPVLT